MKDYSSRPLSLKLGIGDNSTIALVHAPRDLNLAISSKVAVRREAKDQADVIVAFFSKASDIEQQIKHLSNMVFPGGNLWIA